MKTIFIFLALFTANSLIAQDKTLQTNQELTDLSVKVCTQFSDGKISKSIDLMRPYWPIDVSEIDALEEKTLRYVNMIKERYGKSLGYSYVKTETIGDFAIRETYLIRYNLSAVRLKFTYYKTSDGWILNAFNWDDSYAEEFK